MTRYAQTSFGAVLLAASLSGCMTVPPGDGSGSPLACNASTLGWTIGQPATQELLARAQQESRAKIVRVIRPGQMVTMEYSEGRLNLYVDAANQVERYACG